MGCIVAHGRLGSLRGRRGIALLVGAVAAVLLTAVPARGATTTLVHLAGDSPVSAYGGRVLWSSLDPASRRYALMIAVGGVVARVPVADSPTPFDAQLGPDGAGRTVAVFSRCADQAASRGSSTCDVHLFDFTSGRESPVPAASSPRYSEALPSVWGNRIAFAREDRAGRSRRVGVYVAPLHGRGHATRVKGGSTQYIDAAATGVHRRKSPSWTPTGIALRANRIAFAWQVDGRSGSLSQVQLWVGLVGKRLRDVAAAYGTGTSDASLVGPVFSTTALLFGFERNFEGATSDVVSYDLRSGAKAVAPAGFSSTDVQNNARLFGLASDGSSLFLSEQAPVTDASGMCGKPSGTHPTSGSLDCRIVIDGPADLTFAPYHRCFFKPRCSDLAPQRGDPTL